MKKFANLSAFLTSERAFPWRAFVIALALRLMVVIIMRAMTIGLDDMFQYDMLARSIVAGNGYRWYSQPDLYLVQSYFTTLQFQIPADYDPRGVLTSFRPPLYPAFLALVYFFTGITSSRFFIARLVQAVLNAALVPLTYFIARAWISHSAPRTPHPTPTSPLTPDTSHSLPRLAAWVVAFYPLLVIYPLSLATENLFFVLLLASLLALLKTARAETPKSRLALTILSGFLLGLTALTRSVSLALGGIAVLWVFFALRERKNAVIMFLVISLTVLPWMVRNTLLHGRPTGIESALGYDLYVGYHPQSTGTFQYGISLDMMPYLDDGLRDEIGQAKAIEFIKADPGRIPYLAVRRLGYFFGLERRALTYFYSNNFFGYIPTPILLLIAALVLIPFMIVSASAAFGLALMPWKRPTLILPLIIFGYIAPHTLILGEDRFHITLVPLLAILAALCWSGGTKALSSLWHSSRAGKIAFTLASIAILLLFANWTLELLRDADKLALLLGPTGNKTWFPY